MNKRNVGKNIQLLRNAFGYSQAELAERLGVSTIHLSHIETGKVGMSVEILILICNHLSVTPNDILSGEFNKQNSSEIPKAFFENSPYLTENDQTLLLDITGLLAKKNQDRAKEEKTPPQSKSTKTVSSAKTASSAKTSSSAGASGTKAKARAKSRKGKGKK